ncbi:MAG: CBS domain-containing protein [Planctomycetes bacterium]|nr:CBS domain-containing protein [Planctomycetota bacterium]
MFKAKDVMTKVVITVWPQMPIYDAIRTLANRNITGLPVVDADLTLIGILSEKDVLKTLYASEGSPEQTVKDFMSTEVISFDANDSLIDLCDCLTKKNIIRVPITEGGKLLGIVSRSDVIRAILRLKHQQAPN